MSEVAAKGWYVIYGKSQKEDLAQHHIRLKGLDVFFPKLRVPEHMRQRQRVIPLFPNYLFVHLNFAEQATYVRWLPGVKYFVCENDTPLPIDDHIVDVLRAQANADGLLVARSNLKVGQQVLFDREPYEGLIGIIQEPPNAKGRIKVLMQLLNRKVNVEIPLQLVRSGWSLEAPSVRGEW